MNTPKDGGPALPTHPIMEIDDEVIRLQRQLAEIRSEVKIVGDELQHWRWTQKIDSAILPHLIRRLRKIAEGK